MDLETIVMFCILMENNGGIKDKAPGYIQEKYEAAKRSRPQDMLPLLDKNNQRKFQEWKKLWMYKEEK